MTRLTSLVALAALLIAAPLTALAARCPRECRHLLKEDLRACRAVCPKHRPGHDCRSACSAAFKAEKATCKAATNPTPPNCGETTITTTTTSTTTTTPPCQFLLKWYGSLPVGYPVWIASVATDARGNVYAVEVVHIAEAGDSVRYVERFDATGTSLAIWFLGGGEYTSFRSMGAVATDTSGNVYVTDGGNNLIEKFDPNGVFLMEWGSAGSGDGQFSSPSGVAIDASGNVYVADWGNSRVQKFDPNGVFLTKWGSAGSGDGQFSSPSGVAIDASGNVYVADWDNGSVQKFDPNGVFLTKWGGFPPWCGDGQFCYPSGVATDANGNVYVADAGTRVQKFDPNGVLLASWGSPGSGDGQFDGLSGVATDASGNVYVGEIQNHRIQKFACP